VPVILSHLSQLRNAIRDLIRMIEQNIRASAYFAATVVATGSAGGGGGGTTPPTVTPGTGGGGGYQEGGHVAASGMAMVHAGEVIANEKMMQNIGKQMAGVGGMLTAAEPKMSNTTLSFDGAVFHGVPDQRYVNSVMDTAVRSLRAASRTWAFNPKGQ
jgi:hypothetical protein